MTVRTFGFPDTWFLIQSLRWTLLITLMAVLGGGLLGFTVAIARVSTYRWVRAIATIYINVIQGIPVLMVLFLSYYGLGLMGFRLQAFAAASLSMIIYASAYFAEIWRGSIQSVPRQQWEGSESLAMTRFQQYRYVILPQAIAVSLPSTVGFTVQVIKNTSIVSLIGFIELTRAGQLIVNTTFQPFQVFIVVAILYFVVCYPLSRLSRGLERRLHARNRR